ncbi:hypothetical protein WDM22_15975 [Bradyrhizobium septentrionale]|uniref:hypothetical protein n=1 Tax=Bradyrhizobium septentrionale TaxID=1404411 RepID=UPI0030CBFAE1
MSRRASLLADQRGAVALEVPAVWLFLMLIILLPLADIAIAGFQYISARQALRNFGYSILYTPPTDVTSASTWSATAIAKADPKYPISNFQIICGASNAACSSGNNTPPRSYSYQTSITITPIVLKSVLCGSGANGCTFTVPFSERFQ